MGLRRIGDIPILVANVAEQQPQNTNGGTNIAGENIRTLNTIEVPNTIGAVLTATGAYAGKGVDLPPNNYIFEADAPAGAGVTVHRLGLFVYDQSDNLLTFEWCDGNYAPGVGQNSAHCKLAYNTLIPIRVVIKHYMGAVVLNTGLGVPVNQAGVNEHYTELSIMSIGATSPLPLAPDTFGSNANGYWHKNGQTGLIKQFGTITPVSNLSGTVTAVLFPIAFSSVRIAFGTQVKLEIANGNSNFVVKPSTETLSGLSVIRQNNGNLDAAGSFYWEATGY